MGNGFFVHESSYIDEGVSIGDGTRIWYFCHIQKGAVIGKNCSLGQNVNVANNVKIGDGVKIQNNVSLYEGVELEDYVFCGPSCVFTNDLSPRSEYPKGSACYKKTLVRTGALIGAGAVVTSDVPDHALMLGIPARRRGWVCECGAILKWGGVLACKACSRKYIETENGLKEIE